jgi:hypothetical protein
MREGADLAARPEAESRNQRLLMILLAIAAFLSAGTIVYVALFRRP